MHDHGSSVDAWRIETASDSCAECNGSGNVVFCYDYACTITDHLLYGQHTEWSSQEAVPDCGSGFGDKFCDMYYFAFEWCGGLY